MVPTRVLFDTSGGAHYVQGPDRRLEERLASLRAREFVIETLNRGARGEGNSARTFFVGYLADVRRAIANTPPPESRNTRRRIISWTYIMLEWGRDEFNRAGMDDLGAAVTRELEWIQENT